jgi:hypothetical protein
MKYNIDALGSADVAIAKKHRLGGEKVLYATADEAKQIGELLLVSDASGRWTPDPISSIDTAGADLAIMVYRQLKADDDAVITFNVTFGDDTNGQAAATFTAPSWVSNKSSNFQHGVARDLTGTGGNSAKTIKAINSLASITNAKRFSAFRIFQLPQVEANWQLIGNVETFDPKIGILPGVPIPDGLDGTAEVVQGRSEQSSLDITVLHRAVVDGIMRFGGQPACFQCQTVTGGVVLVERQIAINCILSVDPTYPDGSEMVKQTARGFMEKWLGFYAL